MDSLVITNEPKLKKPILLASFSGWMNGGEVSVGTTRYFIDTFEASRFAYIEPDEFYLSSFPGGMEVSGLFRPYTQIESGLIKKLEYPANEFYCAPEQDFIFFFGKEPNMNWKNFVECFFGVCRKYNVEAIYFIGSIAGLTPHTREPRITYTASREELKEQLHHLGINPINYEGPASFVTALSMRATEENYDMMSLVFEIPAYVEGYNPRCIETAVRCIANLSNLQLDIEDLQNSSAEFESKLNELVKTHPELAEKVKKLEGNYDSKAFDRDVMGLKDWLDQQGLRVD